MNLNEQIASMTTNATACGRKVRAMSVTAYRIGVTFFKAHRSMSPLSDVSTTLFFFISPYPSLHLSISPSLSPTLSSLAAFSSLYLRISISIIQTFTTSLDLSVKYLLRNHE